MARSLSKIARDIEADWGRFVSIEARPYLRAMRELDTLDQNYVADTADEIVLRFLSNAGSWRGPTARTIKKELNDMLSAYYADQKALRA